MSEVNPPEASPLRVEREASLVRLVLNRPAQGNSINIEMARALVAAAIDCDSDASVRCVILTGEGRFFCAGGDVGGFASAGDKASAHLSELAGTLHMAVSRLARMNKPLLVLVNGPAAGAGISLAALGDIVLAARSATFTLAYGAIGLTPDGGASWLLPRLIGLRKTQELIITNKRVGGDEAEAIGLITRAVDDEALAAEGAAMAAKLSSSAIGAIGAARALLLDSYGSSLEGHLERESRSIAAAGGSPEGKEGVAAFLSKRKPDFTAV